MLLNVHMSHVLLKPSPSRLDGRYLIPFHLPSNIPLSPIRTAPISQILLKSPFPIHLFENHIFQNATNGSFVFNVPPNFSFDCLVQFIKLTHESSVEDWINQAEKKFEGAYGAVSGVSLFGVGVDAGR